MTLSECVVASLCVCVLAAVREREPSGRSVTPQTPFLLKSQQSSALSQVSASLGHSGCTLGNIESDQHGKGHRS